MKLFGTGSLVNSTCLVGDTGYTNGYCTKSGTSMATPVVAGAIAIINQFLELEGRTMSPLEIENVLYKTGKTITELGNNYSRINVYDALLSLDKESPDIILVSPTNNTIDASPNQTFICNATDWQLANITLKVWNTSNLYYNETKNMTGISNETNFSLVDIPLGNYNWNCLVTDEAGNFGLVESKNSLTIGVISVNLISPSNNR